MRTIFVTAAIVLAASTAQTVSAQRRPATEADALSYIHSAFLTQADPGVMGRQVVLGPELQSALNLPPSVEGTEVYAALVGFAGDKHAEVRKATPQEVAEYGARRGFDRSSGALYTVEIGQRKFLLQYDLQRINVFFVGQLGLPDPDPQPVVLKLDPAPEPMKDERRPSAVQWTAQFDFNSAELSVEMRAALDTEIFPKVANGDIRVLVSGHADRIGDPDYNQKLSERRADALRAYLVAKGMDESKIESFSYGTTLPAKDCGAAKGRALIECLAPNRRVELEITAR